MKYFLKALLGHETFSSMVSWATNLFMKNLLDAAPPPPSPCPRPYLIYDPLLGKIFRFLYRSFVSIVKI